MRIVGVYGRIGSKVQSNNLRRYILMEKTIQHNLPNNISALCVFIVIKFIHIIELDE